MIKPKSRKHEDRIKALEEQVAALQSKVSLLNTVLCMVEDTQDHLLIVASKKQQPPRPWWAIWR